ncbi:HD-GYP domain-containing protein [Marinobacterium stanieri]|uniref:HD domain-containing protein n=1 Tax=Marinobacterium stanieri TaxID=49186 RepID=A0A1N6NU11_9GAMM|nr:HD domain-containing phosphohydrolase [Marinobacterium stanieri]SIP95517.1 HD domain-containing protein [Marinobacterium stanieri]
MKPSIKTITLRKTLWSAFVFLVSVLLIIAFDFHSLVNQTMRDKGLSLAKSVETTLTSHMLSSNFEEKEKLIALAGQLPGISELRVVRSPSLNAQFNLREQPDALSDAQVQRAFSRAEVVTTSTGLFTTDSMMRILYPYTAEDSASVPCLSCHEARPGEVLAVLDFKVDTSEYLMMSSYYLLALIVLFVLALIMVGRVLVWVLDRNVRDPLQWLVERTQQSYLANENIDTTGIESLELDEFAAKVNAFNQLVLQRNAELEAANQEIQSTQREIILTMGAIGEARSRETANHVVRVAELSQLLGRKLGLNEESCNELHDASPMHDIGKVGVPDSILNKPGKLTDEEFAIMQTHSQKGHDVFSHSRRPLLQAASIIALHHHERWDGEGYPQGLKGEDIHIYGRIVAVADVFDALISRRCYKEPWPEDEVYQYFKDSSGGQFDPALVALVLEHFDEMLGVINRYQDNAPQAVDTSGLVSS